MMNRESGATTVTRNDEQEIVQETPRSLEEMVRRNELQPEYISNIWITMTQDLDATFPASDTPAGRLGSGPFDVFG